MTRCLNCNAENRDDAVFCTVCGFTLHWGEPDGDPPTGDPPTEVLPVEMGLDPPLAQVTVGERITVRIVGGVAGNETALRWRVLGDASRFSFVRLLDGVVVVDIHPAPGEQPRSLPLQLQASGAGGATANAAGNLELLARQTTRPEHENGQRRWPLIAGVVISLLVVVAAVVAVTRLSGDDTIDATVAGTHTSLRVHSTPAFTADNVVDHIRQGDHVTLICKTGDFATIGDHRFVDLSSLSWDGDPRTCRPDEVGP